MELDHVGWAAANLLFPYAVPIVLFRLIQWLIHSRSTPDQQERLRITYLLKEGQFGLTSGAVAAAAFYELLSTPAAVDQAWGKALVALLIVLGGLSLIVFVFGTIYGAPSHTEFVTTTSDYGGWFKAYRAGAASIVLAFGVAVCAFAAHMHVLQHPQAPKPAAAAAEKLKTAIPGQ